MANTGKASVKGPGDLVADKLAKNGKAKSAAAKDVGITVQTFDQILKNKSFNAEYAVKFAKYFGDVKAEDLLTLRTKYLLAQLKEDKKFQEKLSKISKIKPVEKASPAKKGPAAKKGAGKKAASGKKPGAKRGPAKKSPAPAASV
jgi:plasmid maintenance system antidote protein VapI